MTLTKGKLFIETDKGTLTQAYPWSIWLSGNSIKSYYSRGLSLLLIKDKDSDSYFVFIKWHILCKISDLFKIP